MENLKNRCRLLIEIANAVRKSWPKIKYWEQE